VAKKTERCIKGLCMRVWFRFNASNGAYHVLGECLTTWSQHYVLLLMISWTSIMNIYILYQFVCVNSRWYGPTFPGTLYGCLCYSCFSPRYPSSASTSKQKQLSDFEKGRLFLPMNKDGATNELQPTWAGIPSTRSIDPWSSVFLVPNVFIPSILHICARLSLKYAS
jgi:hypothetical protein